MGIKQSIKNADIEIQCIEIESEGLRERLANFVELSNEQQAVEAKAILKRLGEIRHFARKAIRAVARREQ